MCFVFILNPPGIDTQHTANAHKAPIVGDLPVGSMNGFTLHSGSDDSVQLPS